MRIFHTLGTAGTAGRSRIMVLSNPGLLLAASQSMISTKVAQSSFLV